MDGSGNLFVADNGNNRIREVTLGGSAPTISTVAGGGNPSTGVGDTGQATAASLQIPTGVVVDSQGNLYIADSGHNRIREVTPANGSYANGIIQTFAGNGSASDAGEGGPAAEALTADDPTAVAVDSAGDIFSVGSYPDGIVREVIAGSGEIITVTGGGTNSSPFASGAASSVQLINPQGIAVDSSGHLFIADTGRGVIREVSPVGGNYAERHYPDGRGRREWQLHVRRQRHASVFELPPLRRGGQRRKPLHRRHREQCDPQGGPGRGRDQHGRGNRQYHIQR